MKALARSLTCLNRIPEVASGEPAEPIEPTDQASRPVISFSCDNLNGRARLSKDRTRVLSSIPPTNDLIFRTNSSLKKSRSEITNITTSYERTLRSLRTSRLDDNNNEQSNEQHSNLTEIIIKTNLRQLENNPDYCHFKI